MKSISSKEQQAGLEDNWTKCLGQIMGCLEICFCCSDAPTMDPVKLVCCNKMIHWQCLLACLRMNSQCMYCHHILDIVKVLEYPIIDTPVPSTTNHPTRIPASVTFKTC